MKKSRYFPFERNRYFYGKLLTVRDFESEQKYFNDKRRMLNRLLHGSGVVTGLQVIAVDDKSVSVEMGAAIDALGREVIVPSPVTLKLSMVEGFTNNEYAKNVYLCIAYDEKGKEPVHSVGNQSVRSDEVSEYNRVLEGYRLFVKEEAPDPTSFGLGSLAEETCVLYQDGQVRVLQTTPRYVNPGELFEVELRIEKTLQTAKLFLDFDILASNLSPADGGKVTFEEPQDSQETEYVIRYAVQAGGVANVSGMLAPRKETSSLRFGDRQVNLGAGEANSVAIIDGSVRKRLLDDYFNRTLDAALESPSDPCIYLARIGLLQMGPTYMIEKVEPVPFDEYVYSTQLLKKLERFGEADAPAAGGGGLSLAWSAPAEPAASSAAVEPSRTDAAHAAGELAGAALEAAAAAAHAPVAPAALTDGGGVRTGVAEISVAGNRGSVSPFGRSNKLNYVTEEIEHGLGTGNVYIMTGIEEEPDNHITNMLGSSEKVFYGASDVFKDTQHESAFNSVSIGTIAYPRKGTFRIGIKLQHATDAGKVRVRWWAFRQQPTLAATLQEHGLPSFPGGPNGLIGGAADPEAAAGKEDA
ncbi:MAG: hypothetical protein J7639_05860 [Paenibacillaceae bacterium]|nr:hypothetical protein [Paenibacillaceae bacterium]